MIIKYITQTQYSANWPQYTHCNEIQCPDAIHIHEKILDWNQSDLLTK